jgi:hypothetical protein
VGAMYLLLGHNLGGHVGYEAGHSGENVAIHALAGNDVDIPKVSECEGHGDLGL